MAKRVCVIGCGAIGSLYAAHLARVAEVWAYVRRAEHARALEEQGLRVSGKHGFTVRLRATADARELPECGMGIVCTKATQTAEAVRPVRDRFRGGVVLSAQNGRGSEESLAAETGGWVLRGTTVMSGTKVSDTEVRYELDTATWLGPFEPSGTPMEKAREAAELLVASGLKAEALEDARPAQWSKLIFNASVNGVAALTGLPHCRAFAEEQGYGDLGRLVHELMEEGKRVAAASGVELEEDPWEMNRIGAETDHAPSMLYDVEHRQATEVEFLGGAIAREAERTGTAAPLHLALYRLIRGKELSWRGKRGGG